LDVPLVETLLAGWALAAAGLPVPDGALAPAATERCIELVDGRLCGRIAAVPFAREVDHLAVVGRLEPEGSVVAVVERAAVTVEPRDNLAGEPRDRAILDGARPVALASVPDALVSRLWRMGAVARACQMAGALQTLLARSLAYAGERVAFD